ncbi:hypothetical protein ACFQ5N_10340 [Lutibacter holmesii]|uniref:Uncharacterized protein n=1 Tax=Lutibacter holmesii TaxID=1137985 RepID=A0ABW3WPP8_9FLAO
MKCIIFIDKYSDWLEVYSPLMEYKNKLSTVKVFFLENARNDKQSMKSIFDELLTNEISLQFCIEKDKNKLFSSFKIAMGQLSKKDIAIAPYIRYRNLWSLIYDSRPITVHLTEVIPDTFGPILYRVAFRGKNLKSWLTIPFAYVYALLHKPDICYFPFFNHMKNSFVKETKKISIPIIYNKNKEVLQLCFSDGVKRPLLISGFGFDLDKMVKSLNIEKYVATSKNKEIIVDGNTIPLEERICAEEVVLTRMVTNIIGYNSTAMVWAKIIDPQIKVECYTAKELNNNYGRLYALLSKKALKKIGVIQLPEPKQFVI